jgi:hypothetical protein
MSSAFMDTVRVFISFGASLKGQPQVKQLKSKTTYNNHQGAIMSKNNVLVAITASREKEEIVYRVESSSDLTNEEFEYYLSEMISGICKWKKNIWQGRHPQLQRNHQRKKETNHIANTQKIKVNTTEHYCAYTQASISLISFTTRLSISSLISRTLSTGLPLGSSSPQSTVVLKNGPGQISEAPHPIVIIKSASLAISVVSSLGLFRDMSIPLSFITATTRGFIASATLIPALSAVNFPFP